MSTPSRFSPNPVLLLVAGAAGFVWWVAHDAARPSPPPRPPESPAGYHDHVPFDGWRGRGLSRLHPGMPLAAVERYLERYHRGQPPEEGEVGVWPGGELILRLTYRFDLFRPLPQLPDPDTFVPGPHRVTLTFDVTDPDLPLVGIAAVPAG